MIQPLVFCDFMTKCMRHYQTVSFNMQTYTNKDGLVPQQRLRNQCITTYIHSETKACIWNDHLYM